MSEKSQGLFGAINGVFQKGVSRLDDFMYGKTDMKPTTCTDAGCAVVFVFFMIGMTIVSIHGLATGNLSRLNHGYNWQGHLCGVDENVIDRPLLYFCMDPTTSETSGVPGGLNLKSPICVASCPTDFNELMMCKDPKHSSDETTNGRSGLVHTITIKEEVKAQHSYPTSLALDHYCLPNANKLSEAAGFNVEYLYDSVTGTNGPIAKSRLLMEMGGLKRVWPLLIGCAAMAILLGYCWLFLLDRCAKPLVYISLGIFLGLFLFWGIFFILGIFGFFDTVNPYFTDKNSWDNASLYSGITGVVLLLIHAILLTVFYFAKRNIDVAVGCVIAACECLFALPSLFFLPLITTGMKVLVFVPGVWIFMYLVSSGEMVTGGQIYINGQEVAGLRRHFFYTDQQQFNMCYFVFGVIWLLEITNAIGQFASSWAVVSWYYVPLPKKDYEPLLVFTGMRYGFTYHLGSVCFGAFLLAGCRFLRLICEFLAKEAQLKGNKVVEYIAHSLAGCITCIMNCIGFLNKNAYVDIAINSTNFCPAARNAYEFISRNAVTLAILNGACNVFVLAGTLLITGSTSLFAYSLITSQERWTSDTSPRHVSSPLFVASVIAVMAAFISHSFMSVFDHTADVLLYTFCWNREHGHNSVSRFAPPPLQLLVKYEKLPEELSKLEDEAENSRDTSGLFDSVFWSNNSSRSSVDRHERRPLI